MIELVSKKNCSGCSACFNACRVGALSMEIDETGFWFPQIDQKKCIDCGACVRACPAVDKPDYKSDDSKAYIVQNKDDEIRKQSTSGGAFTAIVKQVLSSGGVVFGAAIDDEYNVSHVWVDSESDLYKFRSSKYVQSKINTTYRDAEKFLKAGIQVLFSGTPCQIYGLKKYLGKDYDNLFTVDVMCRAVPSPKVLNKYLDYQKKKYPSFDRIVFRDKGRGYSYSCVTLYQGSKVLYREGSEYDPWLRLFLGGYCNREACHKCLYQFGVRASDITLWDCWGTQNYAPEWDDNKGTTTMVVWTKKGYGLIDYSREFIRCKEISKDSIIDVLNRKPLSWAHIDKKKLYMDCDLLESKDFIEKYAPIRLKVRLKRYIRVIMYAFHIHNAIRMIIHRARAKRK